MHGTQPPSGTRPGRTQRKPDNHLFRIASTLQTERQPLQGCQPGIGVGGSLLSRHAADLAWVDSCLDGRHLEDGRQAQAAAELRHQPTHLLHLTSHQTP